MCNPVRKWVTTHAGAQAAVLFYPWRGWAWLLVLQHCHSCTDSRRCQPATGYHAQISLSVSLAGARCPRTSPHRHTPPAASTATGRWRAASSVLHGWKTDWSVYRPLPPSPDHSRWRSWSPGAEWGFPRHEAGRWLGRNPAAGGGAAVARNGSAASLATWTRSVRWSFQTPDCLHRDRGFWLSERASILFSYRRRQLSVLSLHRSVGFSAVLYGSSVL